MCDAQTPVGELKELVRSFSRIRNWEQFHNPKDLGVALAIEVGELLEFFRYRTDGQIAKEIADEGCRNELGHELADCFWLLLRLADVCNVDLSDALREKLVLADEKYPVDKVFGLPHKYTHYQQPSAARSGSERQRKQP